MFYTEMAHDLTRTQSGGEDLPSYRLSDSGNDIKRVTIERTREKVREDGRHLNPTPARFSFLQ